MSQITFYRAYEPVAVQVIQYQRGYAEMTTAQRAEGAIKNSQDMNKVFADKVRDEMLGHHVDILA